MADKDGIEVLPEVDTEGKPEIEAEQTAEVEGENGETSGEISIAIEGESPASESDKDGQAPVWVKELRKSHREAQKRVRELEDEVSTLKPRAVLAAKPTLESCEYDEAKYESALTTWHDQRRKVDEDAQRQQAEANRLKAEWDNAVTAYKDEGKTLGVKDFAEVEAEAKDLFSVVQQGIIIKGSQSPAKVMYALGKNPELARKLALQTDHIKFAFAVAQLESKIVTKSNPRPKPETVVRSGGGSPMTNAAEKQLEKLRAEAAKTGDYTRVSQFKRQLRAAK